MKRSTHFSPEVRERAVRLVREHQGEYESPWATIGAIAAKIGCTAETLRRWVRQAEKDSGEREGVTTAERERIKELAAVEWATLAWVDWFNHRRLLEPIGYIHPPRPKPPMTTKPPSQPWLRDSHQPASGIPGAVHITRSNPFSGSPFRRTSPNPPESKGQTGRSGRPADPPCRGQHEPVEDSSDHGS
jgi:transposase